jgi:hypothetical protein
MPVEVGCRGFTGQSLWNIAKMLGMRDKKSMCTRAGIEAEMASMWLWQKRNEDWGNW